MPAIIVDRLLVLLLGLRYKKGVALKGVYFTTITFRVLSTVMVFLSRSVPVMV